VVAINCAGGRVAGARAAVWAVEVVTRAAITTTNGNGGAEESTGLRATLEAAMAEGGLKMKDLTVLANQNDPFRVDTPAGHRDGEWLAVQAEKLGDRTIHLRGLHYMVIGETKPDGTPYTNTDADWLWLASKAGKGRLAGSATSRSRRSPTSGIRSP
jgi:hypothetical protein